MTPSLHFELSAHTLVFCELSQETSHAHSLKKLSLLKANIVNFVCLYTIIPQIIWFTAAYGRISQKTRGTLFLKKFYTQFCTYHVWSMQTVPLLEPKRLHGSTFYAKSCCVCDFFVFPKTMYPLFLLNYGHTLPC